MRIIVAANNSQGMRDLRRAMLGEGLTCDAEDAVNYDGLSSRIAEIDHDVVLVSCNGRSSDAVDAIRSACAMTGAPVLASGSLEKPHLIRAAMKAGCAEYLSSERLREELNEAVAKIAGDGNLADNCGQAVAIFSPSGGVGVSTAAINLATRLAKKHPQKVALVDLKPAPSDMALLLDLSPEHTTDLICRNWKRIDSRLVAQVMTKHSNGIHVLPQAGYPNDGGRMEDTLSRDAVRQLVTLLRRMYSKVVLDIEHELNDRSFEAMRMCSFIALIARPDVAGLRRARWALDTLVEMGLRHDRFRLIVNGAGSRGAVTNTKAEQMLGLPVFQSIPEDRTTTNKAINRGMPLVSLSGLSRIGRSFSAFAKNVEASERSPAT